MAAVNFKQAFAEIQRRGWIPGFLKNVRGQFERPLSLGIDFGTQGERYVLWDLANRKMLQWGRSDDKKQNRSRPFNQRLDSLRQWRKKLPSHRIRSIQVNIQDNTVSTGTLHVPAGNEADQKERVRLALQEQLQAPLDEVLYFASSPASGGKTAEPSRASISFGAASRQSVFDLVDAVEEVFHVTPHIHLQGDIDAKVCGLLTLNESADAVAFLNIGRSVSILSIFQQGRLSFQRHLPLAGQDMTRAIMMGYLKDNPPRGTTSLARAEELKRKCALPLQVQSRVGSGVTPPEGGERRGISRSLIGSAAFEGGIDEEGENQKIFESIEGVLKALLQDIRMSFEVYRKQPDSRPIARIFLHGGSAPFKNLPSFLKHELGIETEVLRMDSGLAARLSSDGGAFQKEFYEYATALGLALGPEPQTNLTPPGVDTWRTGQHLLAILRGAGIVLLAAFVLSLGFITLEARYLLEVEKILLEHRDFLKKVEAPFLEMVQWKEMVEGFHKRHLSFAGFLDSLADSLPTNVLFSRLSLNQDQRIEMEGIVLGSAKRRTVTVVELLESLRETGRFQSIQMSSMEDREEKEEGRFRLEGKLATGG